MADYFPVLSRAVAGLENNTGEARRAVYDRARAAIVRQLRAIEPPLSEEDIARERMGLEEAIRKVEASAGGDAAPAADPSAAPKKQGGAASQPAARPTPPPNGQRPGAPKPAVGPNAGQSPAAAPRGAQEPPREAPPRPDGRAAATGRPATRPDGRPIIRAAGEPQGSKPKRRSGALIALGALALIAIGVGAFAARGPISALFKGDEAQVASTEPDETPAGDAQPADAPTDGDRAADGAKPDDAAGKSEDRLPQDGAAPSAPPPPSQDAAQQQPPDDAPPQDQPGQPPQDQPAPPPEQQVARAPDAPPASPPAQPGPLVAQRATLYEEGANQQSGEALTGTVVWRTESVAAGQNQPLETALRGEVEIPGRDVKASIVIRRNIDATLPASHTIEVQFKLPENFPNAGIANVPGILMKADEAARGAAMAGLSVRVTSGFFLIGLSNVETERSTNEQLLRDRGWLDIPILYDNGRRAVLTLEKGTPGQQAFDEAFDAWRSAAAAQGNQSAGQSGQP